MLALQIPRENYLLKHAHSLASLFWIKSNESLYRLYLDAQINY